MTDVRLEARKDSGSSKRHDALAVVPVCVSLDVGAGSGRGNPRQRPHCWPSIGSKTNGRRQPSSQGGEDQLEDARHPT